MKLFKKYKYLKESNVDWVGEIPTQWDVKKLKFVFQIQKRIAGELGFDVLSITQNGIKIKDIKSGGGQLAMDYSKYQRVFQGDFAMNHMDLLTGYVDISKFDGVISPDYRVFSLIDGNCNPSYLLRILQLCYRQKIFFAQGQGASQLGRWRMPADNFKNFSFPIPPLEEQTTIANFLDYKTEKINRFIKKKKQLIKLLKEQKAGIINQAVTKGLDENIPMKDSGIEWLGEIPMSWEVKPLKYYVTTNDEALSNNVDKDYDLKYIDIGNVNSDGVINEIVNYKFKDAPLRARRIVKSGDVIVSTVRTYLKAIAKIEDDENIIVSTGFAVLRPKSIIISDFLNLAIRANYYIETICANSFGVSYPSINSSQLVTLKLCVPNTLIEQEAIVNFIKNETVLIDKTISIIQKEIKLVEEYKTALIAEAVTGKIDVRDFKIPVHENETYQNIEEELDMVAEDGEKIVIE